MILGIGTDIVEISRIQEAYQRTPKLLERILTSREQVLARKTPNIERFLAKHFAAKEAVVKALGTGLSQGVSWQHINIYKDSYGKPLVELSEVTAGIAQKKGINEFLLSYSDEQKYVVAFVIAQA